MTYSLPKILITGSDGQLACALRQVLPTAVFFTRAMWDISNLKMSENILLHWQPDIIINTAAYTNVDKAESEKEEANAINHLAVKQLAQLCQQNKIHLLHLSTDYVFNGEGSIPYAENSPTAPINQYGLSKNRGEIAIQNDCPEAIILRTSGVFSEFRHNFLRTMLHLAEEKTILKVVADQVTCPTYAGAIAQTIKAMLHQGWIPGIYHFCSAEPVTWHQFAVNIIAQYRAVRVLKTAETRPIASADYATAAKRPAYSVLNCQRILNTFNIAQPSWQEGIAQSMRGMIKRHA